MARNADRYAAHSRPDKVRFIFRGMEPMEAVTRINQWVEAVMEMHGWSEGYTRRHVRVMPYNRGGERKGVIFQLTYRACELCYTLGISWMPRVNEVELKTYVEPATPESYDKFLDDVQNSEGRLAAHVYYPGAHSSPKKGKRTRKLDLGSRKSQSNVKVYKRPGERPGVEVTARGKAVKKIADQTAEYAEAVGSPDDARALWGVFFARCARYGYLNMHAEMVKRGVDLAEYFSDFTMHEDESFAFVKDDSTFIEAWKGVRAE